MKLFKQLDGAAVILVTRGLYHERDLYLFEDELYAKHGSAMLRLRPNELTSNPSITWKALSLPDGTTATRGITLHYTALRKAA